MKNNQNNQNTLSKSIQLDLYTQASKLKQVTNTLMQQLDSENESNQQLEQLIDSLKSSEIEEIVLKERTYLREIFQSWRLLSLKTYDVYALSRYQKTQQQKIIRNVLNNWHQYTETTQLRQVQIYRLKTRREKLLLQNIIQSWADGTKQAHLKQIKQYDAQLFQIKRSKLFAFKIWKTFYLKRQNSLLQFNYIQKKKEQSLLQKSFSKIKQLQQNIIQSLQLRMQQQQQILLTQILLQWLEYSKLQKKYLNLIKQFRSQTNMKQKAMIFQYIYQKAEKHLITRRINKLGELGRQKIIYERCLKSLQQYKEKQLNKRSIIQMRLTNQYRLAFKTFIQVHYLHCKEKQIKQILDRQRLKQCFNYLQKNYNVNKYKKYTSQFSELFQINQLQGKYFRQLKFYHEYRLKKQQMYQQMIGLHIIKLSKTIIRKWVKYIQLKLMEKKKYNQIKFAREFRMKKSILKKMIK